MAAIKASPTAHLLRNSRLFSLPPPLPKPTTSAYLTASHDSTTSTSPYPTHAAIETPTSSLARGDWGLKRPFPRKSTTKTSTPVLRIHDVDCIEHVTNFDSAADHALNLQKWQEMALPLSRSGNKVGQQAYPLASEPLKPAVSVFEEKFDNTHDAGPASGRERWKYRGPWLAGLTAGEFREYINSSISKRKLEFRQFLRERLAEKLSVDSRWAATEKGEDIGESSVEISEKVLNDCIRALRQDERKMNSYIRDFLDLPPMTEMDSGGRSYSANGPPKTHPSAGLSYLRTASRLHNHPVLGPQSTNPPVEARVLVPQTIRGAKRPRALLGVGGVAADDNRARMYGSDERKGLAAYNPDAPGGTKVWVNPRRASVDPSGRIKMLPVRAPDHSLAVYEGIVEDRAGNAVFSPNVQPLPNRQMPVLDEMGRSPRQSSNTRTGANGYGLESTFPPMARR